MTRSSPTSPARGRQRRLRCLRLLVGAVTVAAGVVTAGAASAVIAPSVAAAAGPCTAQGAQVHYETGATSSASNPTEAIKISAVVIDGLGSGCNGLTAKLLLEGNSAGSSATPATTLSTATSNVEPCTSKTSATPPVKVKTGSITLTLCKTGGAAGYVSVHDLTKLTLSVGGVVVTVTTASGSSSGGSNSGSGSSSSTQSAPVSTAASTGLAFTGADIAAMTVGGLLIILLGLFLLLLSRRRRSQASGGETP